MCPGEKQMRSEQIKTDPPKIESQKGLKSPRMRDFQDLEGALSFSDDGGTDSSDIKDS